MRIFNLFIIGFLGFSLQGTAQSLPPRILALRLDWGLDIRQLPKRAVVSFRINKDGGSASLAADPSGALVFPSSQRFSHRLKAGSLVFQRPEIDRISLVSHPQNGPVFWTVMFGFAADLAFFDRRSEVFSALAFDPPQAFLFQAGSASALRIQLGEDSEPVALLPCSRRGQILVENTERGFTRLVFLRDRERPVSHAIIDFLQGAPGRSDTLQVTALDQECRAFLFRGVYGEAVIQFASGDLL